MTTIKEQALDAAIDLVGTKGLRALTHARVDERAGLPRGSTSNYFRTRRSLVSGVVDRILELERPQASASFVPPASVEEFVDGLGRLFDYITRTNRIQTTARLALFMEASHDADLRDVLTRARADLAGGVMVTMARLGARDPALAGAAVSACFEGLLLHRIARHDDTDPRPIFELVIRAALS